MVDTAAVRGGSVQGRSEDAPKKKGPDDTEQLSRMREKLLKGGVSRQFTDAELRAIKRRGKRRIERQKVARETRAEVETARGTDALRTEDRGEDAARFTDTARSNNAQGTKRLDSRRERAVRSDPNAGPIPGNPPQANPTDARTAERILNAMLGNILLDGEPLDLEAYARSLEPRIPTQPRAQPERRAAPQRRNGAPNPNRAAPQNVGQRARGQTAQQGRGRNGNANLRSQLQNAGQRSPSPAAHRGAALTRNTPLSMNLRSGTASRDASTMSLAGRSAAPARANVQLGPGTPAGNGQVGDSPEVVFNAGGGYDSGLVDMGRLARRNMEGFYAVFIIRNAKMASIWKKMLRELRKLEGKFELAAQELQIALLEMRQQFERVNKLQRAIGDIHKIGDGVSQGKVNRVMGDNPQATKENAQNMRSAAERLRQLGFPVRPGQQVLTDEQLESIEAQAGNASGSEADVRKAVNDYRKARDAFRKTGDLNQRIGSIRHERAVRAEPLERRVAAARQHVLAKMDEARQMGTYSAFTDDTAHLSMDDAMREWRDGILGVRERLSNAWRMYMQSKQSGDTRDGVAALRDTALFGDLIDEDQTTLTETQEQGIQEQFTTWARTEARLELIERNNYEALHIFDGLNITDDQTELSQAQLDALRASDNGAVKDFLKEYDEAILSLRTGQEDLAATVAPYDRQLAEALNEREAAVSAWGDKEWQLALESYERSRNDFDLATRDYNAARDAYAELARITNPTPEERRKLQDAKNLADETSANRQRAATTMNENAIMLNDRYPVTDESREAMIQSVSEARERMDTSYAEMRAAYDTGDMETAQEKAEHFRGWVTRYSYLLSLSTSPEYASLQDNVPPGAGDDFVREGDHLPIGVLRDGAKRLESIREEAIGTDHERSTYRRQLAAGSSSGGRAPGRLGEIYAAAQSRNDRDLMRQIEQSSIVMENHVYRGQRFDGHNQAARDDLLHFESNDGAFRTKVGALESSAPGATARKISGGLEFFSRGMETAFEDGAFIASVDRAVMRARTGARRSRARSDAMLREAIGKSQGMLNQLVQIQAMSRQV